MKKSSGFTLIELLVVISIIGILTSMLLPSLQKARKKTKEAVCLNNQKQIYLGTSVYSADSSDILPDGGIHDSWDARNNGVLGAFGMIGMEDTPLTFHCPLGQTLDTVGQGHNMDIQHPWGAGMSWFNDSSVSRIIVGFNIRITQWRNHFGKA
ncbi:MAG: type II secretion system GspH family protein, partial [Lentisphaeraceae bacterium]|nr:type II secretion system GspH family protein [Lentisphaeraceae bacterium]